MKTCRQFDPEAVVFFRVKIEGSWDTFYLYLRSVPSVSPRFAWGSLAGVTGSRGWVQLVLVSCFLIAANQHLGNSSLMSLLRCSSAGVMWKWRASLSGSLQGVWTRPVRHTVANALAAMSLASVRMCFTMFT